MRVYKNTGDGTRYFRYPAPGSEPYEDNEHHRYDYKLPYKDSVYNIRHSEHSLFSKSRPQAFLADPLGESIPEKLVRYGFLEESKVSDQTAIAQARELYAQKYGEEPENRVIHDDCEEFEYIGKILSKDRGQIAEYLKELFHESRENLRNDPAANDLSDIYDPRYSILELKHWDQTADDPYWRQMHLDTELLLQKEIVFFLNYRFFLNKK